VFPASRGVAPSLRGARHLTWRRLPDDAAELAVKGAQLARISRTTCPSLMNSSSLDDFRKYSVARR
jgi:hypothetical protein